jgi:hypothetical protein
MPIVLEVVDEKNCVMGADSLANEVLFLAEA